MLTKNQIIGHVKRLLPVELRNRLRVQTGVHGCYKGTVQAWLAGWPCRPTTIPVSSFETYCKTAAWGHGPYAVSPKTIVEHILKVEKH